METLNPIEAWYLRQPEPNRSCYLALRQYFLAQSPGLTEALKYGMPGFAYGKKMICYLWHDKQTTEPYVLWVDGQKLQHSALESGSRARMSIQRISSHEDLPLTDIKAILDQALALHGR